MKSPHRVLGHTWQYQTKQISSDKVEKRLTTETQHNAFTVLTCSVYQFVQIRTYNKVCQTAFTGSDPS